MDIKENLWDDEDFKGYVNHTGELNALLDVMEFKWTLTDQIKIRRASGTITQDWERSITSIVIRCKTRIGELKRSLRAAGLADDMNDALDDLRQDREDDE